MDVIRPVMRMCLPLRLGPVGEHFDLAAAGKAVQERSFNHLPGSSPKGADKVSAPHRLWSGLVRQKRAYQRRFFLPYIVDMLGAGDGDSGAALRSFELHRSAAARLFRKGCVFHMVDTRKSAWTEGDRPPHSGPPFTFSDVELHIFGSGLAFLVLELTVSNPAESAVAAKAERAVPVRSVQELAYALRTLEPDDRGPVSLALSPGSSAKDDLDTGKYQIDEDPFSSALVAGEHFTLNSLVSWLLGDLVDGDHGLDQVRSPAWGLRFYAYHVVSVRGFPRSEDSLRRRPEDVREIVRLARQGYSEYAIRQRDLSPDESPNLHFVAGDVLLCAGREGSVLLQRLDDDTFAPEQRRRLETSYFTTMLLGLHQRIGLVELQHAAELRYRAVFDGDDRDLPVSAGHVAPVRDLLKQVLAFTLCYCFSEVARLSYYSWAYATWYRVFNVQRTWDDLRAEVRDLDDLLDRVQQGELLQHQTRLLEYQATMQYHQARFAEQQEAIQEQQAALLAHERAEASRERGRVDEERSFQRWMAILGAILIPPTVMFSWFGMNYQTMDTTSWFLPKSPLDPAVWLSTLAVVALFIGAVLVIAMRAKKLGDRSQDSDDHES